MGEFKPGDEVVCVDDEGTSVVIKGQRYVVVDAYRHFIALAGVYGTFAPGMYARRFRKVQKRNDRLTIEALSVIKDGFEEPKRAPAKKREKV